MASSGKTTGEKLLGCKFVLQKTFSETNPRQGPRFANLPPIYFRKQAATDDTYMHLTIGFSGFGFDSGPNLQPWKTTNRPLKLLHRPSAWMISPDLVQVLRSWGLSPAEGSNWVEGWWCKWYVQYVHWLITKVYCVLFKPPCCTYMMCRQFI